MIINRYIDEWNDILLTIVPLPEPHGFPRESVVSVAAIDIESCRREVVHGRVRMDVEGGGLLRSHRPHVRVCSPVKSGISLRSRPPQQTRFCLLDTLAQSPNLLARSQGRRVASSFSVVDRGSSKIIMRVKRKEKS